MELLFVISGLCLMVLGLLGSFLPVLPGAPLSWLGLLVLYLCPGVPVNYWMLCITLVFTIVIAVLQYVIPAQGTKRFGGSSYGVWGTNIGLVVGLVAPVPFGFIIGPFLGALIGELIYGSSHQVALKAAWGSFLGFLASTFISVVYCLVLLGIFLAEVWRLWDYL